MPRRMVGIVSGVVVATACVVLTGWIFDVDLLRRFGGPVSMNPVTAVMFLLVGVALPLLAAGGGHRRRIGLALATVVGLVGVVRTGGYLLGAEIEVDRLLFTARLFDDGLPNRMALNTSVGFALDGAALLLLDIETPQRHRPAELFVALTGLIALLALTGHAYRVPMLSQVAEHVIPMAVVTGIAFVLVTAGVLAARPDRGWMAVVTGEHGGGILVRRLLPIVVGLPLVLGFVVVRGAEARLYSTPFGLAIIAVASVFVLTLVVLATARTLGDSDLARRAALDAEQRLRLQLERVSDASLVISDAVATAVAPDGGAVLQAIADQARSVGDAHYAVIAFGTDPHRPFSPRAQSGMTSAEIDAIGLPPHPIGVRGLVAREGVVVRTAEVQRHPAFGGLPPGHPEIAPMLAVPVRHRARSIGNLYLGNQRGGREFTIEDERAMLLFSSHVGVALENARLYREAVLDRVRLDAVLDQLPEGVIVRDSEGRVVVCNQIARAHARKSDGSVEVRTITQEEPPVDGALHGAQGMLEDDGQKIPVLVNSAPIRDREGALAGTVTVFQDITALKQVERMREEWSAVIAHDLRQPVSVILATAAVLDRQVARGNTPDRLSMTRITLAAKKLNRMIGDLLDVSQLEANRLTVRREHVDVTALVVDVVERFTILNPKHRLRLELRTEHVFAWLDAPRIDQVLSNLLSNAMKYGKPNTEILVAVDGSEDNLNVSVTNRGPGIAPEELSRLFARFFRTKIARRSRVEGIGLGLYLCRGLVEAHGGTITVESVLGESTTFRFTVPSLTEPPSVPG